MEGAGSAARRYGVPPSAVVVKQSRVQRPHQQVADEPDGEEARQDVHGERVGVRRRHAAAPADTRGCSSPAPARGCRPSTTPSAAGRESRRRTPRRRGRARYAGIVAKPPPYIVRITQKIATNSTRLPRWPGERHRAHRAPCRARRTSRRSALRPIRSESDDQKMRPAMLNRLSRPAKPAAADAADPAVEHLLDHRRRHAEHADARR